MRHHSGVPVSFVPSTTDSEYPTRARKHGPDGLRFAPEIAGLIRRDNRVSRIRHG